MGKMDATGAYFHKTVGVVPKNSPEELELAVAHAARKCTGPDDFVGLCEHLGLTDAARDIAKRRSA